MLTRKEAKQRLDALCKSYYFAGASKGMSSCVTLWNDRDIFIEDLSDLPGINKLDVKKMLDDVCEDHYVSGVDSIIGDIKILKMKKSNFLNYLFPDEKSESIKVYLESKIREIPVKLTVKNEPDEKSLYLNLRHLSPYEIVERILNNPDYLGQTIIKRGKHFVKIKEFHNDWKLTLDSDIYNLITDKSFIKPLLIGVLTQIDNGDFDE